MKQFTLLRHSGLSLIEILVALVILSVGLLGLAGLQTASLKNNDDAYLRSQATILAYSIIDDMRANNGALVDGNYDIPFSGAASGSDCVGSNCSSAKLADANLTDWLGTLGDELPKGDGEITTKQADTMTSVTVKVKWADSMHKNSEQSISVKTLL